METAYSKAKFPLESSILGLITGTRIRLIHSLVRAHDARRSRPDSILEGPNTQSGLAQKQRRHPPPHHEKCLPKEHFVQSFVVNVGRNGCRIARRAPLRLLLIPNVMLPGMTSHRISSSQWDTFNVPLWAMRFAYLCASHDISGLNAQDSLRSHNPRQVDVRRGAFPVPPALDNRPCWPNDRTEQHIDAFSLEFSAHGGSTVQSQVFVPAVFFTQPC